MSSCYLDLGTVETCEQCPRLGDDCDGNDEWADFMEEVEFVNLLKSPNKKWKDVFKHPYLNRGNDNE